MSTPRSPIRLLLLLALFLSACSPAFAQLPEGTPGTPAPVLRLPTRTRIPTLTPTVTPSPTVTPTPTPPLLAAAGTPIPLPLAGLDPASAGRASGLAAWQESAVTDLDWTPGGMNLVVARPDGISLYDAQTREVTRALYPRAKEVVKVTFRPDGAWLLAGSRLGSEAEGYGSNLELWQGPYWRPLGLLSGANRGLTDLSFSPDGKQLAAAYAAPEILKESWVDIWNTAAWEITGTLKTGTVLDLAFSADSRYLAATPDRYQVTVWDLRELEIISHLRTAFTDAVNVMAFSPDGATLATGHYDGTIRLWNAATGELAGTLGPEQAGGEAGVVESLAFSPDGRLLASGHSFDDTLVRLWDPSAEALVRLLEGHTLGVDQLAFAPNGQLLASASYNGEVRLWGLRP